MRPWHLLPMVAAATLFFVPSTGRGANCVDYASYLRITNTIEVPGYGFDIAAAEGLAYVASGTAELHVVTIDNPDAPALVATLNLGGNLRSVATAGGFVYVADFTGYLHIVDASEPTALAVVATLPVPGQPNGVVVAGDRAFIAARDPDLVVVDVAAPAQPVVVNIIQVPGVCEVLTAHDELLFLACWTYGLVVVDISDPDEPVTRGALPTSLSGNEIAARDGLVCVTAGSQGLKIIDVTDADAPALITTLALPDYTRGVTFDRDGLVFAISGDRLQIFDLAVPSQPEVIAAIALWQDPRHVILLEDRALAIHTSQFLVVDISNLAMPPVLASHPIRSNRIVLHDETAFTIAGMQGVYILDVSSPLSPVLVGHIPTPDWATSLAVKNDLVFVGIRDRGFMIYDVSDLAAPVVLYDSYYISAHPMGLALQGRYLFASCGDFGLEIYDVLRPEQPELVSTLDLPYYTQHLAVQGDHAYICPGFLVVDVSDVSHPFITANLSSLGYSRDVVLRDGFAFVAAGDWGLAVVDISNPHQPEVVASAETPAWATGIALAGDIAYVTASLGMTVIDIGDLYRPVTLGGLMTTDSCAFPAVVGNLVLTTGMALLTLPTQCQVTTVVDTAPNVPRIALSQNVPNPFNPTTSITWEQPWPAEVRLDVYDLAGRRVRTLVAGDWHDVGRHTAQWNGRDESGRSVATGVYVVRLRTAGAQASIRMALVR